MKKKLFTLLMSFIVIIAIAQDETNIKKQNIQLKSFSSLVQSGESANVSILKSATTDELKAFFTTDVTSGQVPLTVQFTDNSTGSPVSWSWDFNNDGVTDATDQKPVYTFTEIGTYTVKLTVNDGTETDELIKTDYITVTCVDVSSSSYVINFEADEDLSAWKTIDANSDASTWGASGDLGIDASGCIGYAFNSENSADDWAISPCIKMEAEKLYEVKFYYAVESIDFSEKLELRYGTSPDASMSNVLIDLGEVYNESYKKASAIINTKETIGYYFGWHCYSDANMYNLYIDSVSITELTGSTIVSTTTGGNWYDESTWEGGVTPKEYDDVVINGNVSITGNGYKCKKLVINANDTLTIGPAYNDITLEVYYNVINNGAIIGKPQGHNLTAMVGGNITNNGYWQSVSVLFDGKYNNEITMSSSALFKYVCIMKNDSTSTLFLTTDGMFYNCFFTNSDDDKFGISDIQYKLEILGGGSTEIDLMETSSIKNISLTGNNNILKNGLFLIGSGSDTPQTLVRDVHLEGNNTILSSSVFFTDNVIVDGSLKSSSNFNVLNTSGTFINNGSIIDDNTGIRCTGNIINNGDWDAYKIQMQGDENQTFRNNDSFLAYIQLYANVDGAGTFKWYRDGQVISGATEESYIPSDKSNPYGVYYCETDAGKSRTITISNSEGTAVKDIERSEVSIYPNPVVNGYVFVRAAGINSLVTIELISVTGQVARTYRMVDLSDTHTIDVSTLASGIYIMNIHNENYHEFQQIVIKP